MKKTKSKPSERWFAIDADGWLQSAVQETEQLWDETLVIGPCKNLGQLKDAIKDCAEVEGMADGRFFIVKQETTLSLQPATTYKLVEGGELTCAEASDEE
jgi:hypothetical protein